MIQVISTYKSIKTYLVIKNLISFCFVLFVLMKPVVTFATSLSEEKQELIDVFENNSTEEKEDVIEFDGEMIYETVSTATNVFSKLLLAVITTQENSLTGCFEIQLPPPKALIL